MVRAVAPQSKRVLMWKLEDGPEGALEQGSPDDVGPAWIETYATDGTVTSEKVPSGDWITRSEAHRLAEANRFELMIDDGNQPLPDSPQPLPALDLKAINMRLRALGVKADELTLRAMSGDVFVVGSLVQHLDLEQGPKGQGEFVFTIAGVSMSPEAALSALGKLVPDWSKDR
jgi:hypothetical protein